MRQIQSDLLGAMREIAYVVDMDGNISNVGQPGWRKFAGENKGQDIADESSVVGKSILDYVQGDDVKDSYRRFLVALRNPKSDCVEFDFRCDSPSVRRDLRMIISPIRSAGIHLGYLFQCLIMDAKARPPISLFDAELLSGANQYDQSLPFLSLCSYCQKVRDKSNEDDLTTPWLEAEEYYRRGGNSDVRISHGICPECMETKVQPQLDQWYAQ